MDLVDLNYSIYFDSPQLTFYNEHAQGLPTRSKPRLRTYRDIYKNPPLAIFLEFKYRDNNLISKERRQLSSAQAQSILNGEILEGITYNTGDPLLEKFAAISKRIKLRTTVGVLYHRMAFSCSIQRGLRVTFDTRIQFTNHQDLTPPKKAFKNTELLNQAIIELKYREKVPKQILSAADKLEFRQSNYSKYAYAVKQIHEKLKTPIP